jgi:hypothetical protein
MMGKRLDLKRPKTFNEKLQWLKLYDRNPMYIQMSDKYKVREYIAATIGKEYLIPLLGVWDSAGKIDFDSLPRQFVLKCTHDSGSIIICHDKNNFDTDLAKKKLKKRLNYNYYYHGREWCYKNITPGIIAEKYMTDESGTMLKDYKVFCFNGESKLIEVDIDRFSNHIRNFYSPEWNYQLLENDCPTDSKILIERPNQLKRMILLSNDLSKGIPQVRIDWYSVGQNIYFGEFTFYDGNGFNNYNPPEWDELFGNWIILPNIQHPIKAM